MTGLAIFTVLANESFSEREVEAKEGVLKKLTQIQKRKTIASDLLENRRMDIKNLEQSRDIVEFRREETMREGLQGRAVRLVEDRVVTPSALSTL
jgi:hypothetical protein